MLKVCGVTFVRTTNYGSCFQAYALQKAINSITVGNGEKCEHTFIPLWNIIGKNKNINLFQRLVRNIKHIYTSLVLFRFKSFQENIIKYNECISFNDLPLLNNCFDAFVCGSDVIWNPTYNNKMGLYYCDFAEKYKFSYAPSFGKLNIEEGFLEKAGKWIAELSGISVREKNSMELISKYSGKQAEVVADPVILLKRDEWNSIVSPKTIRKKYIFSYTTFYSPEYKEFLRKLSKKTGLPVVNACWGRSFRTSLKQGVLIVQKPEKWLQLLRDAEYVVTNSFHATVFSCIFHKNFFTVLHGDKYKGSNMRLYEFLDSVGLSDRLYLKFPDTIDLSNIDFTDTDRELLERQEYSYSFLRRNLEAAYEQKNS